MRRKKDPRRIIVLGIFLVLAVLVGIAVMIKDNGPSMIPLSPMKPPAKETTAVSKDISEMLIRGCLFDLGVSKDDARFTGTTIKISRRRLPDRDEILRAFRPAFKTGEVSFVNDRHFRVKLDSMTWNIIFSGADNTKVRCAIIVDDLGVGMKPAVDLCSIDADLTFAVLPEVSDTLRVARYLHERGKEILLHLPMQGNGLNPGPGAIYGGMSEKEVLMIAKNDIRAVPYISGVNNHMGSRVTADSDIMRVVLAEIKDKDLFFVDSLTTSASVCGDLVQELDIPFIARDVFLDNELSSVYISAQLDKLVKIAGKRGYAVGICHAHPETIAVLASEIPRIRKQGVEVVRVSELINQEFGQPREHQ